MPGIGSLLGMGAGAAIGGAIGGGKGAQLGSSLGAAAGGLFGGSGGGPQGPSYYDLLNQRNMEMGQFAAQLAESRANYIQSMGNLNKTVMSQFTPNLEANLASRGINAQGGAFQAELARQSAMLGAQANVNAAQMGQQDINSVYNWAGNPMSLGNPYGTMGYGQGLEAQRYNTMAQGGLVGNAMGSLMQPNQNGQSPFGQAFGGLQSLFNRSPVQAPSNAPGYQSFNDYNNAYNNKQGADF